MLTYAPGSALIVALMVSKYTVRYLSVNTYLFDICPSIKLSSSGTFDSSSFFGSAAGIVVMGS